MFWLCINNYGQFDTTRFLISCSYGNIQVSNICSQRFFFQNVNKSYEMRFMVNVGI